MNQMRYQPIKLRCEEIATALTDVTQSLLGRLHLPAAQVVSAAGGTVIAAILAGGLGAAVGVAVRNAAMAGCAVVLWSYALEPFISSVTTFSWTEFSVL